MNIPDFLKQDIYEPSLKEYIYLLILLLIPNIFFVILGLFTLTARPLINLDYVLALFFILIPNKWSRLIGVFIFIAALFFDFLMLIVQIFPFMNLSAIRYLSSFILDAPKFYLLISTGVLLLSSIIFFAILHLSKKIKQPYSSFILSIILIFGYVCMTLDISYARFHGILGRDNYYIAHSQTGLYLEMINSDFSSLMEVIPDLKDIGNDQNQGIINLENPYNSKILLIVAESWGEFKNKKIQKEILNNILIQKNNFTTISTGSFQAIGATVAGELRELCSLTILNNGFALNKIEKEAFAQCLPNKLKKIGYNTFAMHGTSGLLYERKDWYPKAGFKHVVFGENLLGLRRCIPFKGVCDTELMQIVADTFKENRSSNLLFYWMTLTSHQPYAEEDIHNLRFNCSLYELNPKSDTCRNAQLQTQFFDELARLIQKPEMKGVEVIIVGDHQPPIIGEDIYHFKPLTVGYLHFKVK